MPRSLALPGAPRAVTCYLFAALLTVLLTLPAHADNEFSPSSVEKGVLLVASPRLTDPNFRQTVVLVVEHGSEGTMGLILNRPTNVLLSEALPQFTALKGSTHRLFVGGPVEASRLLLLVRLKEPPADARAVFDGVYVGATPAVLERIITQANPAETFRAFAGSAGWAPGQLTFEMNQGGWAILPPESFDIFDKDPATLWQDCLNRLQAPRVISH
ncbi:MAG: YqgE/AlgH family protein [Nitrospiraceae bacterium]